MTDSQQRQCQSCKIEFTIEPEDFAFYHKIDVPPPTWCPDCRLQRRLVHRNERNLYSRNCDLCSQPMISIYRPNSPGPVYCQTCWWSDKWDPLKYGRDYDFSKPFFQQFHELLFEVPRVSLVNGLSENAEYTHLASDNKDSYLLFESSNNEKCDYSYWMQQSKDCVDCAFVNESELCYEVLVAWKCYQLCYSRECRQCTNSYFLRDCIGVSDCWGCVGLRHKQYHIFNKEYSKEEYERLVGEKLANLRAGGVEELKQEFEEFSKTKLHKYGFIEQAEHSTGNYLVNVKNCRQCFHSYDAEDNAYGYHVWRTAKDTMDCCTVGRTAELMYETMNTGMEVYNIKFGILNWYKNHDLTYNYACDSSSYLFGCSNLRQKQYCILNKQYTKEEYEALVPKIIEHMHQMPYVDAQGREYRYGEFFPLALTFFGYNETSAYEHFPLDKEQAVAAGYFWIDPEVKNVQHTLTADQLPTDSSQFDETLTQQVIQCTHKGECQEQCTTAFKLMPQEILFYRKLNLPLPRFCHNCRHHQRLTHRNPLNLWQRQCQCAGQASENGIYPNTSQQHESHAPTEHCPNSFETSYAPDRDEIVYCAQCYQVEVT